jgi:putative ABC transport system substrate-binding protein
LRRAVEGTAFQPGHRALCRLLSKALQSRHAIVRRRFFAEDGGLLSYGNDVTDNFRRAATYADPMLRGAKSNELPVQAPGKFELVINLKTAKTLGCSSVLTR